MTKPWKREDGNTQFPPSRYKMAQGRWHTAPVQRKQHHSVCTESGSRVRTEVGHLVSPESRRWKLAALGLVTTHLNVENEGEMSADRFPNMDPLTFNCDCADFIALGKILSFLHSG